MLGLNFPKLFYGRLSRSRVAGCRADFCEFCVCVCRHNIISFEAAAAVFFVPIKYEEFKRESRCEICRTQFPLSMDAEFKKDPYSGRKTEVPITELIEITNPDILEPSVNETKEMIQRTGGDSCFIRQRLVGFLQSHEDEYRLRFRSFGPTAAIGSIQATLVGFALSFVTPLWISLGMMFAIYMFAIVVYWTVLRRRLYKEFEGRMDLIISLIGNEAVEIGSYANDLEPVQSIFKLLHQLRNRFPNSSSIFNSQFRNEPRKSGRQKTIDNNLDYVSTVSLCQR